MSSLTSRTCASINVIVADTVLWARTMVGFTGTSLKARGQFG